MTGKEGYRGRFAPSPTGQLHAGSLLAALASWLDARAHGGIWVVRIEDIDPPRDIPGAGEDILKTLSCFGMESDEPVLWQHDRLSAYSELLQKLKNEGRAYGCACSRRDIALWHEKHGGDPSVYPGICRSGTHGRPERAVRFRTDSTPVCFEDRRCGAFSQVLEDNPGDFVIRRADGLFAYQLAVVADDAFQGITDIVRGEDLLDNTPRQIALQKALGFSTPRYMHLPLVRNGTGEKLSKQTKAAPLDTEKPLYELERVWRALGFPALGAASVSAFLKSALPLWKERWAIF